MHIATNKSFRQFSWHRGWHLVVLGLAILSSSLRAQTVPFLINYQGQISNPNGSVPDTGDYELSFSIYDTDTGGTRIWGPQKFNGGNGPGLGLKIPVVQGYFNVMLGPMDTAGRSISSAFSNPTRYVEIRVGNNSPIAPRQRILSAPFALQAEFAAQAVNSATLAGSDWKPLFGVNTPAGTILPGKIPTAAIDSTRLAPAAVTRDKLAAGVLPSMDGWQSVPVSVFSLDGVTTAKSRRVGENAEFIIDVHFNSDVHDQVAASSGFSLDIPYTIEFGALPTQNRLIAGTWHSRYVSGDQTSGVCIVGSAGVGASRVGVVIPANRIPSGIRYNHQCEFSVMLTVPVAGWRVTE